MADEHEGAADDPYSPAPRCEVRRQAAAPDHELRDNAQAIEELIVAPRGEALSARAMAAPGYRISC